jgi:hypothetical protein
MALKIQKNCKDSIKEIKENDITEISADITIKTAVRIEITGLIYIFMIKSEKKAH